MAGDSSLPFRPEDYEAELEALRVRLILWAAVHMGATLRAVMDPEDLADIVLEQVHRDRAQFRGTTRAEFRAWVFGVAHTTLMDEVDRAKAQKRQPREIPRRARTTPSQAAQRCEQLERLREAVGRLKEEHREVIRLVRLEERTTADVAASLGITPNAVRVRMCRALKALSEELGPATSSA